VKWIVVFALFHPAGSGTSGTVTSTVPLLTGLLISFLGAIILLAIVNFFRRGRAR
jgi:hypothetical protein